MATFLRDSNKTIADHLHEKLVKASNLSNNIEVEEIEVEKENCENNVVRNVQDMIIAPNCENKDKSLYTKKDNHSFKIKKNSVKCPDYGSCFKDKNELKEHLDQMHYTKLKGFKNSNVNPDNIILYKRRVRKVGYPQWNFRC